MEEQKKKDHHARRCPIFHSNSSKGQEKKKPTRPQMPNFPVLLNTAKDDKGLKSPPRTTKGLEFGSEKFGSRGRDRGGRRDWGIEELGSGGGVGVG